MGSFSERAERNATANVKKFVRLPEHFIWKNKKEKGTLSVTDYISLFSGILEEDSIILNEPMSKHTSYRIGGPADVMLLPDNIEQIKKLISVCRENSVPFYVIGNGSNVLVRDGGIRGAVIKISNKLSKVTFSGNTVKAEAGAILSSVVKKAYNRSLSGLEFACGIPGSIGGAITMNAGAYGGHMADIVKSITVLDKDGNVFQIEGEELGFGYRQSVVRDRNLIVLSGEMELAPAEKPEIKEKMDILTAKRKSMQPLNLPSCGSVFKRPEGQFIGKLIEEAGLKGTTSGGAQVSMLHANFIVNINNATAKDVLNLIETVKQRVFEKFLIEIETEVIILGEDQ